MLNVACNPLLKNSAFIFRISFRENKLIPPFDLRDRINLLDQSCVFDKNGFRIILSVLMPLNFFLLQFTKNLCFPHFFTLLYISATLGKIKGFESLGLFIFERAIVKHSFLEHLLVVILSLFHLNRLCGVLIQNSIKESWRSSTLPFVNFQLRVLSKLDHFALLIKHTTFLIQGYFFGL